MPNIDLLFPSVVYTDKINLKQQLIDELKSEEVERSSTGNSWLSKINLHKKRKYRELMMLIDYHINLYTKDVMRFKKTINFGCCGAWTYVNDPGDWAQEHFHPNSMISGVLYLDVPPGSGCLRFPKDPHRTHTYGTLFNMDYIEEFNNLNALNYDFVPERGTIYLFPSTLVHSVSVNQSNDVIYSFGFDYVPTGKVRTTTNEIIINV